MLARDGHTCSCWGACGHAHAGERCGAPPHGLIVRDPGEPARWQRAAEAHGARRPTLFRTVRVVLTIAHRC